MDELVPQLELVDIIISSTGATSFVLHKAQVSSVMRARKNKPLFFIDIAVPRDLDPQLIELENIYLYDIDDLSSVVEVNKSERDKEAVKAGRIVDEETLKFQRWYQGMAVTPTIQALKKKVDTISKAEIEKSFAKIPEMSEKDREIMRKMVGSIAAKMLHNPVVYLKSESCAGRDNSDRKVTIVRELFGLSNGEDER